MTLALPYTLANGPGNKPDADKFNADYWFILSMVFGNFVANPGFEVWGTTSFSNPATAAAIANNWTWRKSGTSSPTVDVSRESTIVDSGSYAAKANITGAGSANSFAAFDQSIADVTKLRGQTLAFGASVRAATANKVRLRVTDGTSTAYSDYHSGGATYETLKATISISASATSITISVEIISDFTGAVYADSVYVYVIPSDVTTAARALLAFFPFADRSTVAGDIYNISAGSGLICTTPDGNHTYRLAIDNDGAITSELLT